MPKIFTLAILAEPCTTCFNHSILRYTTVTGNSHKKACRLARQIGALVVAGGRRHESVVQ